MKNKFFLSLCVLCFLSSSIFGSLPKDVSTAPAAANFSVKSSGSQYSKLKCLLLCPEVEANSPFKKKIFVLAKTVKEDLDFTDQFDVELQKTAAQNFSSIKTKKLFDKGFSLLILLKKGQGKFVATVKDTNSDTILCEKNISLEREDLIFSSHTLAADILESLTGDRGVCLSSLAYCKEVSPGRKVICVSDYACKQHRVVVRSGRSNLAPYWHGDHLFYSCLTGKKNELRSYNTKSKRIRIVSSYKGLNMQPAISADGKRAVLCLSGGRGNSDLYLHDEDLCRKWGRKAYTRLTSNNRHNVSPCMLPDGNIVFCSDFRTGQPQLFHMDLQTRKSSLLTSGRGYAAAPCYCKELNQVVYVRLVGRTYQLFALSLDGISKERQLTFGRGNKDEPSWSEDGRYIAFSIELPNGVTQLAVMNHKSGKVRVLTRDRFPKSFPCWTSRTVWV